MLQRTFSAPVYVLKYISLEVSGEREVARTLDDYLRGSARANSPSVARARSVFDQAYAIARQVAELSQSALVRRVIDVERLERAIKNWPAGGWHTAKIFQEYNLALTRGVAGGRFLRWFEQAN